MERAMEGEGEWLEQESETRKEVRIRESFIRA